MECNREDAEKACNLAEEKYKSGDLDGAIRMALKAETLFPLIPGLSQMLAAFYVHLMKRESLLGGEVDWYAILGADSDASLDTVRKKFRKMCLLTHPDKNKSAASEEAFKLVNEAWRVLAEGFDSCPKGVRSSAQVKRPSWFSSDEVPNKKESSSDQHGYYASRSSTDGSGSNGSSTSSSFTSSTTSSAGSSPEESSSPKPDAQSGNTGRAKETPNSPTDGSGCPRKEPNTKSNAQSGDHVSPKQPNSGSNKENPNTKPEASSKNSRKKSGPPPEYSSDTNSGDTMSSQKPNGGSSNPRGSTGSSTTQSGVNQRFPPGGNGQNKKTSTAFHSNSGFPRAKWVAKEAQYGGNYNLGSAPQSSASSRSQSESDKKSEFKESGPETSSSRTKLACPKCDRMCLCIDPSRLAIRCQHCNILALRQVDGGVFGIVIGDGTIDILGGSNVRINVAKMDGVEVEGETNVYVERCDNVSIKGGRSIQLNRCDNINISGSESGNGSF